MDRYKKRSINFSRNVENRELRAHRRSVDRQKVKNKRLSVLRQLDLKISENSLQETPPKLPESSGNKEKQKKPSRIEMLHKWKAEKDLKKKLEAKKQKPVFKVSHVKYSPPPVLRSLPRPVSSNSKEKTNSFIPRPVTSKVALPESTQITRSKVCSMQDKGQRKPVYNRYNFQLSKNQTQGASSTMKTSRKYLSNISFRNKGVSNISSSERQKKQSSAVAASKSTTQDVPDFPCEISNIEPQSSEVSFAPSNFLFSAPENLTSFVLSSIFDPSTKNENSGLLKRMSTPRQKPDNSEICTVKNMAQGMRNSNEKGLPTGVKDSPFNMLLETIDEKIEDCVIETDNNGMQSIIGDKDTKENVPKLDDGNKENNLTSVCETELQLSSISSLENAKTSKRGKSRKSVNKARGSSNELSQTPRRSARLSSFFANSPTPLDSRFLQKSEKYANPENDTGIPSAGLATFIDDTPLTSLSCTLSRLRINHSLTAQQDQESASRPLTRSQDRISLLGTPQRRLTRSQKIVKEDLITFSPSV